MKTFQITETEVKTAFDVAKSDEAKKILAALFCKPEAKPSLGDYKSIKSYEDACEALDISPILNCPNMYACEKHPGNSEMHTHFSERMELPSHIIALIKLETISRALWGKEFQPKPDAEGSNIYYYPWFALYTKEEIERMDDNDKGALLSAHATAGAVAGFGSLYALIVAPRLRLRTLGSACARKRKKKQLISVGSLLNFGLSTWLTTLL